MKKTKLVTMLGAVSLIGAIGAGSTFAYLTSTTGTVSNTFTVGNVNFDEDLEGGLSESKVARNEKSGLYEDVDGTDKWLTNKNSYTDLVAGEKVYKDPTAHMASDSQKAYLFIRLYNSEAVIGNEKVFAKINIDSNNWKVMDSKDNYVDYVFIGENEKDNAETKGIALAGKHYTLFTEVTMGNLTEDMKKLPNLEVKACAVQYAGFDTPEEAYKNAIWTK